MKLGKAFSISLCSLCWLLSMGTLQAQQALGQQTPPLSFFFPPTSTTNTQTEMDTKNRNHRPQMSCLAPSSFPAVLRLSKNRYPSQPPESQPLFCRLEWQWEKRTGLPWKLRLGSLSYVNNLEGK